jgi:excisionase family DNA binding protein
MTSPHPATGRCDHCGALVPPDGLRDIEQAAEWLNIPKSTLRDYVSARSVPFTFVGRHARFAQHHLDAIVAAGEQQVIR